MSESDNLSADDSPVSSLDVLDDVEEEIESGKLPLRVYNDPDIYQREREAIFGNAWIFVGHETEIPEAGDYARRFIGEDPFIFVRGEDGEVHVLFDSCRHRGTRICRAEQGNASHFRCPYHGWTYKNDGSLAGVPKKHEAYDEMDTDDWGLVSAPRVENYKGFVFASLAEEGPSFEEHLGDFRWYFDLHVDLFDEGLEVIGDPHRWEIEADWKVGAENFAGDGYHVAVTHQSIPQINVLNQEWTWEGDRYYEYIGNIDGHSALLGLLELEDGDAFFAYPEEIREYASPENLSEAQFEVVKKSTIHVGTIFPNFSFIHQTLAPGESKQPTPFFVVRTWQPRGPGSMELWSWVLGPAEASDDFKEKVFNSSLVESGPSGQFEQDDTRVWEGISASAGSVVADKHDVQLNYQSGMDHVTDIELDDDWPGPGTASRDLNEEYARTFHRSWAKAMREGE